MLDNKLFSYALAVAAFSFVLFVNGALPSIAAPTVQQALGTTVGFAQSLLNDSETIIYATNFGFPTPMPRSFGLAGVLVTELYLWLGLKEIDAYSLMVASWLLVAFLGAFFSVRALKVKPVLALLLATLWLIQPIVVNHAGYSMLSLGFALLPLYFFSLFLILDKSLSRHILSSLFFVITAIVAVFMDGYTYFMFLIGASIIVTVHFVLSDVTDRQYMLRRVLPVFALGGGLSFALYKLYIGELDMTPSSMDFFRGWGVDLSFIAIPTQGKFWLWDMLELSIPRSGKVYFGDASVWNTTFSLPLILIGFYGLLLMRKRNKYALGILFASLFGIYMAMGPSVKVNSIKPEGVTTPLQAAQYAVMPTGNAILSDNLPGFKSMRASYRWHGLFLIGAWVGLAFFVKQKKNIFLNLTVVISMLLATVPPPFKKLESSVASREDALYFDNELLPDLKKDIEKNSLVAFVPYGNDLTLNYVASKLDFRMLNVGGDKNLRMAKKNWPYAMIKANKHVKNEHLLLYILDLLNNGVETVVLPYFDTLWGVHDFKRFGLVKKRKQQELVKLLMTIEGLSVESRKYYSVVRKNENFNFLDSLNKELCIPPYCINKQNMKDVLTEVGYYENGSIYSTGKEGFLKFGPYNRLNKGKYRFNFFGGIVSAETAWVDIVSNKGALIHARFELVNISSTAEGVLLEKNINIEQDVADLEVRVYVEQMDNLRLDSYSLLP